METKKTEKLNKSLDTSPHYFFPAACILVTCIKLLMIPLYRSTDFEVHRNWLAITHNLPIKRWYYDSVSQWTLDYPPLFAWFEYAWAVIASHILSPNSLKLSPVPIETPEVVLFQRISVIISDVVYLYAIYQLLCFLSRDFDFNVKRSLWVLATRDKEESDEDQDEGDNPESDRSVIEDATWFEPRYVQVILLVLSPGLLIVDHIHFQYNGFLMGFFLLSIVRMMEGNVLSSSLYFAALLHLKHIYIYAAPAFFFFILRNHCLDRHYNPQIRTFLKVSLAILAVSFVSLAPFIQYLPQVLTRLFPFKRGLTHAYWAPNIWSLYNFVDLILFKMWNLLTRNRSSGIPVYVTGVVQDFSHEILPNIRPWMTFLLIAISMIPALIKVWRSCHFPSPIHPRVVFLRCLTLCCLSSFLFSWHVHEKAILMPLLPLTILTSLGNSKDCRIFLILSMTGTISLFPLLPNSLIPVKVLLLILYHLYALPALFLLVRFFHKEKDDYGDSDGIILTKIEKWYLWSFVPALIFTSLLHPILMPSIMPFLPLAITSVHCSFGVVYSYLELYRNF